MQNRTAATAHTVVASAIRRECGAECCSCAIQVIVGASTSSPGHIFDCHLRCSIFQIVKRVDKTKGREFAGPYDSHRTDSGGECDPR